MKNKEKLSKIDFIEQLSKMTKEEMYDYIKKNSKPRKPIRLYYLDRSKIGK